MGGHNLPLLVEIGLMYVSENLGKAAALPALPALPLITPLKIYKDWVSGSWESDNNWQRICNEIENCDNET